ncbi:hypothetical protein GH5_04142 [Leishmania sp. Ghana 2012 LV757]|uniref:hypothetical protein n=1 Tax=Leishmania sp. Ghana 2012 LV757 TaxID=2803181 RepID=UPI001B3D499E|nr:hypothetical protein GH5_04142 [Leishmania sp. Ghana 2012 LV757]
MPRHSKYVRMTSVAVVLTVIGLAALSCTPALCISATEPASFELSRLLERIPQMSAAAKAFPPYALPQIARLNGDTPQMEPAQTFLVEPVHDDASKIRAVSPDVITTGAAAAASAEQLHKLPTSLSAQLLHSPLATGEVVHPLVQLHKASPSLPIHQRQQLVLSSYRAAGHLSAQQDGNKAVAVEVTATSKRTITDTSSASEGDSSSEAIYGTILSGGVIASFTAALVFASVLLTFVLVEVCAMISAFMERRRMRAARQTKDAAVLAEPRYGDAVADAHV